MARKSVQNLSRGTSSMLIQLFKSIYTLVVSFWFGGMALFTFIITPIFFKVFDRDMAGAIVGSVFPAYFKVGLCCGVVSLICMLIMRHRHWVAASTIIVLMLIITSYQAFVLEPKAVQIKKDIPSFVSTPATNPARIKFREIHKQSAIGNVSVISGGALLLLLL